MKCKTYCIDFPKIQQLIFLFVVGFTISLPFTHLVTGENFLFDWKSTAVMTGIAFCLAWVLKHRKVSGLFIIYSFCTGFFVLFRYMVLLLKPDQFVYYNWIEKYNELFSFQCCLYLFLATLGLSFIEIKLASKLVFNKKRKIKSSHHLFCNLSLILFFCAASRVATFLLFKSGLTRGAVEVPLISKIWNILNPEAALAACALAFFLLPTKKKQDWILLGLSGIGYALLKTVLGSKGGIYDMILWLTFSFFVAGRKIEVQPKALWGTLMVLAAFSVGLFYLGFVFRIASLQSFKRDGSESASRYAARIIQNIQSFNYTKSYLGQESPGPIQSLQNFGAQIIQRINLLDAPLVVFLRPEVNPGSILNWSNTFRCAVNACWPGKPFPDAFLSEYGLSVCYQEYSQKTATLSQQSDNWSIFGLSFVLGKGWLGGLLLLWMIYLVFLLLIHWTSHGIGDWLSLLFAPMVYNAFYYTYVGFGFDNVVARSFNLFLFNLILLPVVLILSKKSSTHGLVQGHE